MLTFVIPSPPQMLCAIVFKKASGVAYSNASIMPSHARPLLLGERITMKVYAQCASNSGEEISTMQQMTLNDLSCGAITEVWMDMMTCGTDRDLWQRLLEHGSVASVCVDHVHHACMQDVLHDLHYSRSEFREEYAFLLIYKGQMRVQLLSQNVREKKQLFALMASKHRQGSSPDNAIKRLPVELFQVLKRFIFHP